MENIIFRKEIFNQIIENFREDRRYFLLIGDMGFGAVDKIRDEFPNRVLNCGIMEQGMVGIAAGMAMSGMIPVVYTMPNFLAFRAIEQIRNDVVLHNLNVKFIATGSNNFFKFLGHSHTCGQDDITIMKLINLDVYDPFIATKPFSDLVQEWIKSDKASYMRV